jgi:cyclophilin family peptidyl-prolyl cis-trans isomerase/HEAT repeat protein
MKSLSLALSLCLIVSCAPQKSPNKFSNSSLLEIADFQDKRLSDSLYQFLQSQDPIERAEAALAFASIQDTTASSQLGSLLLEDLVVEVRANAAYALGQTKGFAAVNSLIPALNDKSPIVVREVLEALGKSALPRDLELFTNFNAQDSLAQEGLAWAFYRIGLRGLADSLVVNRASTFLKSSHSLQTRLGATHFFNRGIFTATGYEDNLIASAVNDTSPEVRMAAVSGLKRIMSETSFSALQDILKSDKDYRVRVNVIRALQVYPIAKSKPLFILALKDENVSVAIAASEVIKSNPVNQSEDWTKLVTQKMNWRVRANLYEAALSSDTNNELIEKVKKSYSISTNEYEKAALLKALAINISSFPFLREELNVTKSLVVKTTAAQALVDINRDKKFPSARRPEFAELYLKAIEEGDPGVIGILAGALADSVLSYKSVIKDMSVLESAKSKLSLPKDIEALQPLTNAIAYLNGEQKSAPLSNSFNHPIDWTLARSIDRNQKVKISTTKGDIIIQLFVEEAPGSVTNFMDLVGKKYFDGKFFHRVVPNFVDQVGCNRGDGFGSEDYSIRSEFSRRRYKTGSVGMASAGKDTEGTQWFITHSPTPHLEGGYTIFGEVLEGMEFVHQMEVGDQILHVTRVDN